jgi:hypothetical protein
MDSILRVFSTGNYIVAKFIVPDWGDKVDSGIGLSIVPACQAIAGRYDNSIPESTIFPIQRL